LAGRGIHTYTAGGSPAVGTKCGRSAPNRPIIHLDETMDIIWQRYMNLLHIVRTSKQEGFERSGLAILTDAEGPLHSDICLISWNDGRSLAPAHESVHIVRRTGRKYFWNYRRGPTHELMLATPKDKRQERQKLRH
jgi:hypothetical protein